MKNLMLNRLNIAAHIFVAFTLFAIATMIGVKPASAQAMVDTAIPENATSQSYGKGWTCNPGFRESDQACSEIVAPANAFLNDRSYGPGWEC